MRRTNRLLNHKTHFINLVALILLQLGRNQEHTFQTPKKLENVLTKKTLTTGIFILILDTQCWSRGSADERRSQTDEKNNARRAGVRTGLTRGGLLYSHILTSRRSRAFLFFTHVSPLLYKLQLIFEKKCCVAFEVNLWRQEIRFFAQLIIRCTEINIQISFLIQWMIRCFIQSWNLRISRTTLTVPQNNPKNFTVSN